MQLSRLPSFIVVAIGAAIVGCAQAQPQPQNRTDELAAKISAGVGSIVVSASCDATSQGPPLQVQADRIIQRAPAILAGSRTAVDNVLSPEEREALEAFLETPEGRSVGEKLPGLIGVLASVGSSALCTQ